MAKQRTQLHDILDRGKFSPETKTKYENVIDAFIEFAGTNPKNWTRATTQAFYDDLRKRMQANSANTYIASLRYVSKWFAKLNDKPDFSDIMTAEPSGKEVEDSKRHALDAQLAAKMIQTCARLTPLDMRDLALIVVGLETGMRRKSFAGLRIENIGSPNGYPSVRVPIKGRGGDQHWDVPLSDLSLATITRWRSWLAGHKIKSGGLFRALTPQIDRKQKRVYVPTGDGVSKTMIGTIISERAKTANIIHVHPHILRHTFITWRTEQGLTDTEIASITGHQPVGQFNALQVYKDMARIGGTVRNSTPAWLAKLVLELLPQ
jgi:integrase